MPIYEFTCQKCQHLFEELVFSRTSEANVVCPACGSSAVERAMSVFSYSSGGQYHSSTGSNCTGCTKSSCASCGGH
jgi:putative FmdB family regulatory protein